MYLSVFVSYGTLTGDTAVASPPPFKPSDPAPLSLEPTPSHPLFQM